MENKPSVSLLCPWTQWRSEGGGPPQAARLGAAFFDGVISLFFIVYCNKQLIYSL